MTYQPRRAALAELVAVECCSVPSSVVGSRRCLLVKLARCFGSPAPAARPLDNARRSTGTRSGDRDDGGATGWGEVNDEADFQYTVRQSASYRDRFQGFAS